MRCLFICQDQFRNPDLPEARSVHAVAARAEDLLPHRRLVCRYGRLGKIVPRVTGLLSGGVQDGLEGWRSGVRSHIGAPNSRDPRSLVGPGFPIPQAS